MERICHGIMKLLISQSTGKRVGYKCQDKISKRRSLGKLKSMYFAAKGRMQAWIDTLLLFATTFP